MKASPAIYDPERYPTGAKRADEHLVRESARDAEIERLLAKHGFQACGHPDCSEDGDVLCATNRIRIKAKAMLREALQGSVKTGTIRRRG